MYGIRVFGLPDNITDKHLKVYFSNPRNGGGHIENIYHPLPHATAVVIFDDKRVVQEVLKREHTLSGQPVGVSATPKQVFRRAVVELEKDVSNILSVNPQLVDELQFIGEININFQYEKERYLFDGSWYKIEWAMQYLDTVLDAYLPDSQSGNELCSPVLNTNRISQGGAQRKQTEARDDSPPRSHQIKRPNIPIVKQPRGDEQPKSLPASTGTPMSNLSKMSGDRSSYNEDFVQRGRKNKNALATEGETAKSRSTGSKLYSKTMRSNLDDKNEDDNYYYNNSGGATGNFNADEYWGQGRKSYNRFDKGDDSDSENEANLAAAYDRRVAFGSDTNFDENKRRPQKAVPRMTKGIDVAQTDFGEVPLSFTFELAGNIKVHVAMDDITKQTTDTIVNPTTPDLTNVYGVSRAIVASAGHEIQMECQRYVEENGLMNYAGVTHTSAGGNLNEKVGFVIHTAGPNWREEDSDFCTHMLVCTYINCFQYADEKLWVQSLATPLISAGSFGFPLDVCIGAFYDALLIFSDQSTTKRHLKEIHLVCFDQDSAMATITIVQSLLDCDSSQSVAAATDRYWMRKAKHNFQAESFTKPVKQETNKDKSDDEDSDAHDTNKSKPRERTKEEIKESSKEVQNKSDMLSDSDDESRKPDPPNTKANIASGRLGQDTSRSNQDGDKMEPSVELVEPSVELEGSFSEKLKEINTFDEDSDDDSLEIELRDKDLRSVRNKHEDVDSDKESNSETENIEKERLLEENVHDDKKNDESRHRQKFSDTNSKEDDAINTDDDNGDGKDDDEHAAFGEGRHDAKENQSTRSESADDLKVSMKRSNEDDEDGGASKDREADVSDDDEEVPEKEEEELYL